MAEQRNPARRGGAGVGAGAPPIPRAEPAKRPAFFDARERDDITPTELAWPSEPLVPGAPLSSGDSEPPTMVQASPLDFDAPATTRAAPDTAPPTRAAPAATTAPPPRGNGAPQPIPRAAPRPAYSAPPPATAATPPPPAIGGRMPSMPAAPAPVPWESRMMAPQNVAPTQGAGQQRVAWSVPPIAPSPVPAAPEPFRGAPPADRGADRFERAERAIEPPPPTVPRQSMASQPLVPSPLPNARSWQNLWLALQAQPWGSLALVPASDATSDAVVRAAAVLQAVGRDHLKQPIELVDLRATALGAVEQAVAGIAQRIAMGSRVLVITASVAENPSTVPLVQQAHAAALFVLLGKTRAALAQKTIDAIGKRRFVGTVALRST